MVFSRNDGEFRDGKHQVELLVFGRQSCERSSWETKKNSKSVLIKDLPKDNRKLEHCQHIFMYKHVFFDLYLYESWFSTMYRKIDSLNLSWTMKPQLMKSIFLQWNVRVLWLFVSVFWSRVYYNYSYTGCRYHGFSYPFWRVCLWNSTSIPKIRPYLNGTTISNPSSLIY